MLFAGLAMFVLAVASAVMVLLAPSEDGQDREGNGPDGRTGRRGRPSRWCLIRAAG